MKNFSLTQLSYALALEDCGNFGLAARQCHVTQPTLSMQIQKLEDELGVILFDRSKQPIMPTSVGRKILEQAKRIIHESKLIEELVVEEKSEVTGELKLGIIPSLSPYLLPMFLPKFTEKYPKVKLVLVEALTEQIVLKLERDELDAGILVTPLGNDSIQESVLFYEPFWAYLSDGHPLSKSKEIKLGDLEAEDLWLLQEGHCFRGQVMQLCNQNRRTPGGASVRFESGSLDVLKGLVDQGLGATLLPDLAARQLVARAQDARLKSFSKPLPVREVSCVRSRQFSKKRIIDALIESVKECVPAELREKQNFQLIELSEQDRLKALHSA